MRSWLRSLFRRPDPAADFRANLPRLLADWFRTAAHSGRPKGLRWVSCEPLGDPHFGPGWAVLPVMVQFEPTPDGGLEDVPQAKEPRPLVAVFAWKKEWTTTGRAVFNLTAAQVAAQLGGVPGSEFQAPS